MSDDHAEGAPELDGLLQVARHHRRHERFYGAKGLEEAAELRRSSAALTVLADRWRVARSTDGPPLPYDSPHLQAAGCDDLNDPAGTATSGILFMEGEQTPVEITALVRRLDELARGYAATAEWLSRKMDAGWRRESVLLRPGTASTAYHRHMVLMRTTLSAGKLGVAAKLLASAHTTLTSQRLTATAVRADLAGAGEVLQVTAWLMDAAAAVIADHAGELGLSDPDWTAYIDGLTEHRRARDADPHPAPDGD